MKGQTAVEYLMTYGWAILIILIVAGVLAYYGIFAPSGFLGPSSRGFSSIYVVSPWDFNSGGVMKIKAENRVGSEINITRVFFNDIATPAYYEIPGGKIVAAGAQSDFITTSAIGGTGNTGSTYSLSVSVEYCLTDVGCNAANRFNSTGTLTGTRS